MAEQRYTALDGLRAYAAVGIVLMHVLANGDYALGGFVFSALIPSCTHLVFLFMMISAFSMCCGYYEKIIGGKVSVQQFYSRRYARIWPFFALLVLLDVAIAPSREALYEAFANLTLCFGLLPSAQISVIGVGWTLGVIFVFYLLFPFFCYLLSSPRRAWGMLLMTIVWQYVCEAYFFDIAHVSMQFAPRAKILYCAVYFAIGGLVYLYRAQLAKAATKYAWALLLAGAAFAAAYFMRGGMYLLTAAYTLWLIYALGNGRMRWLDNGATRLLSRYSMEIYLCHMVVYRALEKMKLTHALGRGLLSWAAVSVAVLLGALAFAMAVNRGMEWLQKKRKTA